MREPFIEHIRTQTQMEEKKLSVLIHCRPCCTVGKAIEDAINLIV
jgi:hypothetical protein